VALPFFRKNKDKDKASGATRKPGGGTAPVPETQPAETLLTMNMGGGSGIVVQESSGAPQSAVDEAAILYASGQAESAEHLLKNILETGGRRAWHMLFDLYDIQNRDKEFEQLALDYAMRFETSPPVRRPATSSTATAKPLQDQASSLELPGLLDRAAADTLREGIAGSAKTAVIRIDFSRIEMIDEAGADEAARVLAAARKAKRRLEVSGVDRFIALLQDLNRATHSRTAHWLLLLELYQTLGQQMPFEDLAVDYAVKFEVSPPDWSEVQAAVVVKTVAAEPADDALQLSGEITPANDSALQQFGGYAATRSTVLVDLEQVTRVDYGSVGQLISLLMQGLGSGKTITLRGHNALIHELFRVMGIDQLAQLLPHHPE
jgi:ABC-type transporter Mla MlaB component